MEADAKITHAEGGEMGEEGEGESAPRPPMGWAVFLCHEDALAFISCLLFLLFAPDWKFFLRISLFHPPSSPISPWGCFILFPFPSILFRLQMEGKQCRAERGRQLCGAFFTR